MAFDRLIRAIDEKKNPTVAGLDPKLDYVPEFIKKDSREKYGDTLEAAADALLTFNKGLIDSLCDVVAAVKPQCAYYEMYGWQGVKALYDTIAYAKEKGLFVITDGKRNDIGTTMEAYAAAHIGKTEAFGKTFGEMCENWGKDSITDYGYSCVGAVVGATYPKQLSSLRKELPHTFFLVPGYGAQGGAAKDIAGAFDENGRGAVINSSRGIMCAYKKGGFDEKDYAVAARKEAIRMRDEINSVL